MKSSEYRAEARAKLSGKWGKAALIALAFGFISWAISAVTNLFPDSLSSLASIAATVIDIPLSFGLIKAYVKLYNGEDVGAFDFLSLGFSSFGKSWGIAFSMLGKVIVPFILMIVGYVVMVVGAVGAATAYTVSSSSSSAMTGLSTVGIIGAILFIASLIWYIVKSYYYQLAYIIAAEDDNIASKDAVNKSRDLMDGKRWKLFVLQLSFIGWIILGIFTLGIGYLWLAPYIQCAIIAFYKFSLGNNDNAAPVEEKAEIEE